MSVQWFCYSDICEKIPALDTANKFADQTAHLRSLISDLLISKLLCFNYMDYDEKQPLAVAIDNCFVLHVVLAYLIHHPL